MGNAIAELRLGDHVCLTFDSDDERSDAFVDFTAAGVRGGFKMLLFTMAESAESMRDRLRERVPGYQTASARGQVEVAAGQDIYLAEGRFDAERMLRGFATAMDVAERQGYPGLWVTADVARELAEKAGPEALLAYETAVNTLFASGRLAAVCQYDRRLLDGTAMEHICSAHPISFDGARLRFALVDDPPRLALTGELDATNRTALAALLAPLARVPAALTVDASGVTFAGVESAAMLTRLAHLRRSFATTVVCQPQLERLLRLVDLDGVTLVRRATGGWPNGDSVDA